AWEASVSFKGNLTSLLHSRQACLRAQGFQGLPCFQRRLKLPDPVKTQCLFRPILERTGSALIAAHEANCPYTKGLVEGQRAGEGAREWPQRERPYPKRPKGSSGQPITRMSPCFRCSSANGCRWPTPRRRLPSSLPKG